MQLTRLLMNYVLRYIKFEPGGTPAEAEKGLILHAWRMMGHQVHLTAPALHLNHPGEIEKIDKFRKRLFS